MKLPYAVITYHFGGVLKDGKWGLVGGPWGTELPTIRIATVLLR